MAQTTTHINACDARVYVDNEAGLLVDISGSGNDCTIDLTSQLGERRTFGSQFKIRKACGKDMSVALKAIYSMLDAEAMGILKNWYEEHNQEARTVVIELPGTEPGADHYQAEMYLESLNIPVTADEAAPILVSASLKSSGVFSITSRAS